MVFFLRYLTNFFFTILAVFCAFFTIPIFTIYLARRKYFTILFLCFWGPFETSLLNIFTILFFFFFFCDTYVLRYIFLLIPDFTGVVKYRKVMEVIVKKTLCFEPENKTKMYTLTEVKISALSIEWNIYSPSLKQIACKVPTMRLNDLRGGKRFYVNSMLNSQRSN